MPKFEAISTILDCIHIRFDSQITVSSVIVSVIVLRHQVDHPRSGEMR